MISLDGLRKPNYFAHQLLCRLGNEQIPFSSVGADSQTNVIVSRNNNVLQILAYAFDIEYQAGDIAGSCQIEVEIPANANIQAASVFRIDSRNNNILHVWKEMGSPAHPKLQEVKQMIDVNNLTSEPFRGPINKVQQGLAIKLDFETPGVILIEVPLKN
jgi:beta-xylosidase